MKVDSRRTEADSHNRMSKANSLIFGCGSDTSCSVVGSEKGKNNIFHVYGHILCMPKEYGEWRKEVHHVQ